LLQQAGEKLSAAEAQALVLEPVREMANFFDCCVPEIDASVLSERSKLAYQFTQYQKVENAHSLLMIHCLVKHMDYVSGI